MADPTPKLSGLAHDLMAREEEIRRQAFEEAAAICDEEDDPRTAARRIRDRAKEC